MSEKVARLSNQVEELKKSYFKKIKDIESNIESKVSKETHNVLESKYIFIY